MKTTRISKSLSSFPSAQFSLFKSQKKCYSSNALAKEALSALNIENSTPIPAVFDGRTWSASGSKKTVVCPSTGEEILEIIEGNGEDMERCISSIKSGQEYWRNLPAPKRGELVYNLGNQLKKHLDPLATLISLEMGKILPEAKGEVQEYVDVCDYAVGLSRSIEGKVFPSERNEHSLFEMYNPLGSIGIISAFNFPNAVCGWNTAISLICGNTQIVQTIVGERFGKSILELGGNNAIIILDDVLNDEKLFENAVRSVLFASVGTCGQRCTSARRILLQKGIKEKFISALKKRYESVIQNNIGHPLDEKTLVGPLHSKGQVDLFQRKVAEAVDQGGNLMIGGRLVEKDGNFVEPALIELPDHTCPIVFEENFVPILYLVEIDSLEEGIALNNSVEQGLSSALFTSEMKKVFKWLGASGSDTGIVNVNTGCSGAEIGGAFGGNKATGWGRESGSDSWKQYMRRSTCTINYGDDLPLAQGISFE
eukprot:maker-scaffold_94-snap-gene-0.27-mRNA-1 protein AED:0.05 eAED:0.05 QI:7/1/1/1/0/0/2/271/481